MRFLLFTLCLFGIQFLSAQVTDTTKTKAELQIERDGKAEVLILDAAGRVAMQRTHTLQRGAQTLSIPVGKLQRGSYTIQIIGAGSDRSSAGRFVFFVFKISLARNSNINLSP